MAIKRKNSSARNAGIGSAMKQFIPKLSLRRTLLAGPSESQANTHKKKKVREHAVLQRLRENDSELKTLSINWPMASIKFNDLVKALSYGNTTVEEVSISGLYMASLRPEQVPKFLKVIESLPKLKKLTFRDFEIDTLPISTLAEILQYAPNVYLLDLCFVELAGSEMELQSLFSRLVQIKEFRCTGLRLRSRDGRCRCGLGKSLLTLPRLEKLYVGHLADEEDIVTMAKLMETKNGLKEFHLFSDMPAPLRPKACKAFQTMLARNTALEYLRLWEFQIDKEGMHCLAEGLKHNRSLLKLDVRNNPVRVFSGNEAIAEILEWHNYTLQSVSFNATGDARAKIDLYTQLNQSGMRNSLVDIDVSADTLMNTLAEHSRDESFTYHLLRRNPSIVK